MNLWILRLIEQTEKEDEWTPWYDKTFGHVVRAENEHSARNLASKNHGEEGGQPWLDQKKSTCEELSQYGEPEHIIVDFMRA